MVSDCFGLRLCCLVCGPPLIDIIILPYSVALPSIDMYEWVVCFVWRLHQSPMTYLVLIHHGYWNPLLYMMWLLGEGYNDISLYFLKVTSNSYGVLHVMFLFMCLLFVLFNVTLIFFCVPIVCLLMHHGWVTIWLLCLMNMTFGCNFMWLNCSNGV